MASTSSSAYYDASRLRPFHRSASFDIPRSKTPGPRPGFEKKRSETFQGPYATRVGSSSHRDALPRRARTPLPHEEDARYRRRAGGGNEDQAPPLPHRQGSGLGLGREHVHAYAHGHTRHRTKSSTYPTLNDRGEPTHNCGDQFFQTRTGEYQRAWDRLAAHHDDVDVDFQVRVWMMQDDARRIAAAREAERTRLIQDEIRRIQAKLLMQREAERIRMLEAMRYNSRTDEERERVRRGKAAAADRTMANAWSIYERNWAVISAPTSTDPLSFSGIPWPTLNRPSSPSSITPAAISAFLLSDAHSCSQTPRERIKEALRRWHPDRFVRFMRRVPSEERNMVEQAVGIVARCLNELLSRYPA